MRLFDPAHLHGLRLQTDAPVVLPSWLTESETADFVDFLESHREGLTRGRLTVALPLSRADESNLRGLAAIGALEGRLVVLEPRRPMSRADMLGASESIAGHPDLVLTHCAEDTSIALRLVCNAVWRHLEEAYDELTALGLQPNLDDLATLRVHLDLPVWLVALVDAWVDLQLDGAVEELAERAAAAVVSAILERLPRERRATLLQAAADRSGVPGFIAADGGPGRWLRLLTNPTVVRHLTTSARGGVKREIMSRLGWEGVRPAQEARLERVQAALLAGHRDEAAAELEHPELTRLDPTLEPWRRALRAWITLHGASTLHGLVFGALSGDLRARRVPALWFVREVEQSHPDLLLHGGPLFEALEELLPEHRIHFAPIDVDTLMSRHAGRLWISYDEHWNPDGRVSDLTLRTAQVARALGIGEAWFRALLARCGARGRLAGDADMLTQVGEVLRPTGELGEAARELAEGRAAPSRRPRIARRWDTILHPT